MNCIILDWSRELKTPLHKFSVAYSSGAMSFVHCNNEILVLSSS
jgi:hypothetical protein